MSDPDPLVATRSEWRDIEHGVEIRECRNAGGVLLAIEWRHGCPSGATRDFVSTKAYMDQGWTVVSESPLTLSPSLLCLFCGRHGHIRDGKWDPA